MWLIHFIVFILPHAVLGNSEVFITPSDNVTCPAYPCVTLNEYANNLDLFWIENSTIRFLPGDHCLDIVLLLQNASNVKFTIINDEENVRVRVSIGHSAYLMWINGHNIEVNGFIFILVGVPGMKHGCSALLFQGITSSLLSNLTILGNNKRQYSAIFINDSHNVIVSSVKVVGVISFKGAAIHAVNSIIEFTGHSIFNSNTANNGGGAVVLDSCIINVVGTISFINNMSIKCGGALSLFNSTFYVFGNTSFVSNSALIHGGAVVLNNSDWYSYGNGLFINNSVSAQIESSLSNLIGGGAVYCTNSTLFFFGYALFRLNSACGPLDDDVYIRAKGGAISAYYSHLVIKSTSDAIFTDNDSHLGAATSISADSNYTMINGGPSTFLKYRTYRFGGGAVYKQANSTISCDGQSVVFECNAGIDGGAIYAESSKVILKEIVFASNFAWDGGAIKIIQSFAQVISSKFVKNYVDWFGGAISIEFGSTAILDSTNFVRNEAYVGGALIVGDAANVTLCGKNNFLKNIASRNKGGAIYALDSFLNIKGIQNFIRNIAGNGGAMTISGNSKLVLTEMIQINFIENHASMYGGAIYFEDIVAVTQCRDDIIRYKECFIELSSTLNIQLNFSHNTALKSGSILYGGDLDMCYLSIGKVRDSCGHDLQRGEVAENPIDTVQNISYITGDIDGMSEISSAPHQVCLCEKNIFNCTKKTNEVITIYTRKIS